MRNWNSDFIPKWALSTVKISRLKIGQAPSMLYIFCRRRQESVSPSATSARFPFLRKNYDMVGWQMEKVARKGEPERVRSAGRPAGGIESWDLGRGQAARVISEFFSCAVGFTAWNLELLYTLEYTTSLCLFARVSLYSTPKTKLHDYSPLSVSYSFTTCGVYSAPIGPSQKDCDTAYSEAGDTGEFANGGPVVQIGDEEKDKTEPHRAGYVTGIQRWTVPRTDLYT